MELNTYLKAASKQLLKKISELSKDKKMVELYEKYDRTLAVSNEVDYSWSLISTALLLSENLWKNESVYKHIKNESIINVEDKLSNSSSSVRGDDDICNNCLLDSENKVANSFTIKYVEEIIKGSEKVNVTAKDLNVDKSEFDDCDRAYQEFANSILCGERFGCNDSIIEDDAIDYKKLIIRVRHALAHSNYEILNDQYIHLYHYNRSENRIDFNVVLSKEVVITILDELNENFNILGEKFIKSWNVNRSRYLGVLTNRIDENNLLQYLMSFDILDENDCLEVIKRAKKENGFEECYIEDKLDILFEVILDKIMPVCSYGIIVNEFIYGNDNKEIDSEFYEKVGLYSYLNSELFGVNMSTKENDLNKNKLELLIFAFLNCILLNSVNQKNNDIEIPLDFGKMYIAEEYLEVGSSRVTGHITNINNRIEKIRKELEKIDKNTFEKQKCLEDYESLDNNYYQVQLPNQLTNLLKRKIAYLMELNRLQQLVPVAEFTVLTNYILTHLRNALAHGYIKISENFDYTNISDLVIEFSDYNPEDKTIKTFEGTIKLGDLMEILVDSRYIHNVLGTEEDILIKSLK